MNLTITTVIKTDELKQYSRDLAELIKVVKAANGRYVLYVDTAKSATTQSAFISKAAFDNARKMGRIVDWFSCDNCIGDSTLWLSSRIRPFCSYMARASAGQIVEPSKSTISNPHSCCRRI